MGVVDEGEARGRTFFTDNRPVQLLFGHKSF